MNNRNVEYLLENLQENEELLNNLNFIPQSVVKSKYFSTFYEYFSNKAKVEFLANYEGDMQINEHIYKDVVDILTKQPELLNNLSYRNKDIMLEMIKKDTKNLNYLKLSSLVNNILPNISNSDLLSLVQNIIYKKALKDTSTPSLLLFQVFDSFSFEKQKQFIDECDINVLLELCRHTDISIEAEQYLKDKLVKQTDIILSLPKISQYLTPSELKKFCDNLTESEFVRFFSSQNVAFNEQLVMERFRKNNYIFGYLSSNTVYNKLSLENQNHIKYTIIQKYDEIIKNTKYDSILKNADIFIISNFLNYYTNSNITDKGYNKLVELLNQNPNILKTINFGILQDDILDIGDMFIGKISKYQNYSSELMELYDLDKEIFSKFKTIVKSFSFDNSLDVYEKKLEILLNQKVKVS